MMVSVSIVYQVRYYARGRSLRAGLCRAPLRFGPRGGDYPFRSLSRNGGPEPVQPGLPVTTTWARVTSSLPLRSLLRYMCSGSEQDVVGPGSTLRPPLLRMMSHPVVIARLRLALCFRTARPRPSRLRRERPRPGLEFFFLKIKKLL